MSVEDARNCLRKLLSDEEFLAAVKAAPNVEERRAVVAAAGFNFTLAELAEARSLELSDDESQRLPLADEELFDVVGGGHCGLTHEGVTHCGKTHEQEI